MNETYYTHVHKRTHASHRVNKIFTYSDTNIIKTRCVEIFNEKQLSSIRSYEQFVRSIFAHYLRGCGVAVWAIVYDNYIGTFVGVVGGGFPPLRDLRFEGKSDENFLDGARERKPFRFHWNATRAQ